MAQALALSQGREIAHYERASASLLATVPSDPVGKRPQPSDNWDDLNAHLEARMMQMRNWRNSWWTHWAQLAEYILPRRYHWLITENTMSRGGELNQTIVDPTGTMAAGYCAAGMMSGLCSPSRPWYKLKPREMGIELDRGAKLWLDTVVDHMRQVMAGSNFYTSMAQMFQDVVTFGTSPVIIYEDEENIIKCYNPCAGEYFLAVNSSFKIDTFYRQFTLTTSQIVDQFGLDACPEDIQEQWKQKGASLEVERIIAHAIEPNYPILGRGGKDIDVLEGDFTYREAYWVWGQKAIQPLSLRGFKDCPFIAPRWSTTSNDPYGRSVAMDALPDIRQLQVMTRREAEAIDKMVRPPLLADVQLKNEPSSILPGHVTYVSQLGPSTGMRPIYLVEPKINEMAALIKQIQERIKSHFFNDLFLMLDNMEGVQPRNQLEISERKNEKMQILGPIIEGLQQEFSKAIKRIFAIMVRKNLLPPLPDSLKGVPLQIEYMSMQEAAQKGALTAGMERVAAMVGNLAKLTPDAGDNINSDEFILIYGDLLQSPEKMFRAPDEVAKIRANRAKQMAAQQQGPAASQTGLAASQMAKNLSDTKVGGGQSALEMMMSGLGGSQPQGNA